MATAFICTEDDPCSFVVSNGSTHYFHLKASSEVDRQKWVTALELVKAKAIKMLESGTYRVFRPRCCKIINILINCKQIMKCPMKLNIISCCVVILLHIIIE